jgi:DNA-binding transcriptional regulator YiaG
VTPPTLAEVPDDYAARVRGLRLWLDMTLDEFAKHIGAANKAVIYQWESGKRKPSPGVLGTHRCRGIEVARLSQRP